MYMMIKLVRSSVWPEGSGNRRCTSPLVRKWLIYYIILIYFYIYRHSNISYYKYSIYTINTIYIYHIYIIFHHSLKSSLIAVKMKLDLCNYRGEKPPRLAYVYDSSRLITQHTLSLIINFLIYTTLF